MRTFAALVLLLSPLAAHAEAGHTGPTRITTTTTTTTTTRASHGVTTTVTVVEEMIEDSGSDRFVASAAPVKVPHGIASYGPFRVIDDGHAALAGVTDERSPAAFAAMMAAHPGISVLEMVECPGTEDDRANLRLGRMIRARGLATHVPAGGSVRSGAVELFLAGTRRLADRGAEFAVHAWADEDGRQPRDYGENAPENRAYIDYYREMGMSGIEAHAFYDMTNSVPNASARWMNAAQMAQWVRYN
jgi:hypothetical protein